MTPIPIRAAFVQKELRLHITLSGRCDRGDFIALWNRLDAFLRGSGLLHSLGLCSLVLRAEGRDIFPLERALLIAWLVQQPEVMLVHVDRSTPGTKSGRHDPA